MKYIKYLISAAMIASVVGCSKNLNQLPSDSLPGDEAITSVNDLSKAVNGVYSTFVTPEFSYGGDYGLYADAKGGDIQIRDNSVNHLQPIIIFQTDANSGSADLLYQTFYYASARVNNVLLFTDNITDKDDKKDQYNDLLGQLYALRALSHFELARIYAQLPTVAPDMNAENSGIALNDKSYPVNAKFKRSTLKETYDFIVSDFETAIPLLSTDKVVGAGKINQWAAKALLSRVYLYLGNYSKALELAQDVIANGGYTLYTRANYLSAWSKVGTTESLFEITTTDKNNPDRTSLGYYTNPQGYAEASASDDFASWLLAQADDIRSSAIREKNDNGSFDAYYSTKYEGQVGAATPLYTNNPKIIRLSEVYLIAAEAALKGGTAAGSQPAVWYYNELRRNRISPYTDATSITIDDILDERRREFFCENQRMFDLVRNKRNITSPSIGLVKYDDYKILVAIPQREKDISPDLVQNPDY